MINLPELIVETPPSNKVTSSFAINSFNLDSAKLTLEFINCTFNNPILNDPSATSHSFSCSFNPCFIDVNCTSTPAPKIIYNTI